MKATKPLKHKLFESEYCIQKYMREYYYNEYLILSQDLFLVYKGATYKQAKNKFRKRYPSQKILTVKKLK